MNKFQNIKNWLNEDIQGGVTVLYPGGFKMIHGGHLDLIKRYSEHPEVKEVRVLVGPGVRNGIDQDKAVKIAERLTKDMNNVVVEGVKWPSPVLTSFKIIEEAGPGNYALAASKKGDDYKKVEDFVFKHGPEGKYKTPEGVNVIELPINAEPLKFIGRDDEYEGEPISASILRNDIVNDDLDNFAAGYPDNSPDDVDFIWGELGEAVMNESIYNSGPPTVSHTSNYDRSQPGYHYKSSFPIMEDGEEEEDISEGGGGGHLMSPWEVMNLTFGDIREIISKSLSGKLENVSEKLDGQNLMVTVKNDEVYLARTQKQMRNGGELAGKWDNMDSFFGEKTPEFIKNAYQDAVNDLQTIFTRSKLNLDELFKNGHRWLNIELLNPETENIVPYGEFQLRIHNLREVDDNGKEIETIFNGDLDIIINDIEKIQKSEDIEKIHYVGKTNSVIFNHLKNMNNIEEGLIRNLQVIMDRNNLDDENTIGDYLAQEIRTWLEENIDDLELIEGLVQRWAYGNKITNISKLLKGKPDKIVKWVREYDSKIDDEIGEILDPIIELFSKLGIAVLQNLSGIAASNPEIVSSGIKKKADDSIKKINDFINKSDIKDIKDFDKKVNYLETQLRRIEQAGGLGGIAPTEGIVFEYKGNLLKLTGIYLPILKIINFFQFGKDK